MATSEAKVIDNALMRFMQQHQPAILDDPPEGETRGMAPTTRSTGSTAAKRSPRWAAVLTTLFLAIPPASTPPVQARACPARAELEAELLAVGARPESSPRRPCLGALRTPTHRHRDHAPWPGAAGSVMYQNVAGLLCSRRASTGTSPPPLPLRGRGQIVLPELEEGFLDAAGGGAFDALVDSERIL